MVLIFVADSQSTRLNYILNEVLKNRLSISYTLTDNLAYFTKSHMRKINYSAALMEGCLNIPAIPLLYEENIRKQVIEVKPDSRYKYLFFDVKLDNTKFVEAPKQALPFDIFAASFYLLSRYEEYVTETFDMHNRFKTTYSLAFQNHFLTIPLVDIWAQELGEIIEAYFNEIKVIASEYKALHTFDVDFAYKYKGINPFQFYKKALGNLFRFDLKALKSQFDKNMPDPYDTYAFIFEQLHQHKLESIFFFLVAHKTTTYDKNLLPSSLDYKTLINQIAAKHAIGLHPSYYAGLGANSIQEEKNTLHHISNHTITKSRFHFLKFKLPKSYTFLMEAGISKDYTMAYSSHVGFRASTCKPFYFFHLTHNKASHLQVFSPCIMDVTLKNYMQLNPKQATECINQLQQEVKNVNGIFMSVWHNSNLIETEGWEGWRKVWIDMIGLM
jgi:hypothetical protein